jgi:hypothetical protein
MKDVGTTVDKITIPVYDQQSNQMARNHLSPLILFLTTIMKALSKESTPTKDVGTTVDKTMIPCLMMSNQIKWHDITSPALILFPTMIMNALKQ